MKKIVWPLVIILVAVGIFVVLNKTRPGAPVVERPPKKWLVNTVEAQFQTIAPQVTLYGRIETPRDAALKSALSADVAQVMVLEGTQVSAGQLLIRLDDADAQLVVQQRQADLDEIKAQIESEKQRYQLDLALLKHQKQLLDLAERAVVRANKLEQSKLASQANLDDARAAKEQQLLTLLQLQHDIDEYPARLAQLIAKQTRADALLSQAQIDLDRTQIRAPFAGRVSMLNVAEGDRVRAGDALISIYDLDHLEVRAQIPGRYISEVKSMLQHNQSLTATAMVDGQKLDLTLMRLSGEVATDSGGIDGLFAISSAAQNMALGTFVEVQLQLSEQSHVLKLPFAALYGLNLIYKVDNGYLKSVKINKVGEVQQDGQTSLLVRADDIQAGDQIVATQLPNAITGLSVEVSGD